ncbi:Nucleolus and neural progenitor protein [Merluccius polli]|uniref:Nucleolus and neural progenitor protein n=1 Tax=Merluccius polli TaxID=89951 RepID=A0AA47N3R0_MERPO|nr:Nucleolus and neural progenitor protein [Merluccius polli]
MAEQMWNKVNIPFPSAAASVRVRRGVIIGTKINLLMKNIDKVMALLGSNILQTEIRVLYELLFVCKNNHGTNLTFRALKQVEQCINRLQEMKLDVVILDLLQMCPTQLQRSPGLHAAEYGVPSQPMLEWTSLKVLGAARLLTCVMDYCSRSFMYPSGLRARQQLKQDEFIVLSVVITSMVSRLWVYFRALLYGLAPLYRLILGLLAAVSHAKPMPFLTGYPLPKSLTEFLGLSPLQLKGLDDAGSSTSCAAQKQQTIPGNKLSEDVGVALQRGAHSIPMEKSAGRPGRGFPCTGRISCHFQKYGNPPEGYDRMVAEDLSALNWQATGEKETSVSHRPGSILWWHLGAGAG